MIDEKQRRIYYQDIVYAVCNSLDAVFPGPIVCGTVEQPSQQVQLRMKEIKCVLTAARHVLRQVDEHGGPFPHYPELHAAIEMLRKSLTKEDL